MLQKLLNATLLVAAVIGAVMAFRVAREHQELSIERRRLEAKFGSLPIGDPNKIHLRAIDTGEDLHFTWRLYTPGGIHVKSQDRYGSDGSMNSKAHQVIARVRLRKQQDGTVHVYTNNMGGGGSSLLQLGDAEFGRVLQEHWNEIEAEQFAFDDVEVLEADEIVTLLRLKLPEHVMQEAKEKVRPAVMRQFESDLYHIRFGTDAAFQREEERKALTE